MGQFPTIGCKSLFFAFYVQALTEGKCVYCGTRGTRMDKNIPIHAYRAIYTTCRILKKPISIPVCTECAGLTRGRSFYTFGSGRRFVRARLRDRYKKVIALPGWEEEELDELGYELQTTTLRGQSQKSRLIDRLIWPRAIERSEEALAFFWRQQTRGKVYKPAARNRVRDQHERSLRDLFVKLDHRYAGALTEMAEHLNSLGVAAHGDTRWSASSLQKALWRLGIR